MMLQMFVIQAYFIGIRNPTTAQFVSTYTSMLMVVLALSKTLLPPEMWTNKEKSVLSKIKNILWTFTILCTIAVMFTDIAFFIAGFWRVYPILPPFAKKVYIILNIIIFLIVVLRNILQRKNGLEKSKQLQLKIVLIGVENFLLFLIVCIIFYWLILPNFSHFGNGGVVLFSYRIYCRLFMTIVLANAAFTVSKMSEILSFDILTSRNGFMNIFCHFNLLLTMGGSLFFTSTLYYN